jgi:hypothetical protein
MSDEVIEQEKNEIEAITDDVNYIDLGGKKRRLHIGMRAWRTINPELGGLDAILEGAKSDPDKFLFDTIPRLIQLAIAGGEREDIDIETVLDWLDDYGLNDIKNIIVPAVMGAIMNSLPKSDGKKNPRKAK